MKMDAQKVVSLPEPGQLTDPVSSPSSRELPPLPFVPSDKYLKAFAVNATAEFREMKQIMDRVACDDVEFVEYIERCSNTFTEREALKFALDAFGRREIDPISWDAYRTNDGWILRDILNLNSGIIHITDRWTVHVLNKAIPVAPILDVTQANLKFEEEMASMIFDIKLSGRQKDILAEMSKRLDGIGRQALATVLDISTRTVTRWMSGEGGLIAKGLVLEYQKAFEYRLTEKGIYYAFKAAQSGL